jgi:hypothetical protein
MTFRHRRRNSRYTPLQLFARRQVAKAEARVQVLSYGISKLLKKFYGNSSEIEDILDIISSDLHSAAKVLKEAEDYLTKVTSKPIKPIRERKTTIKKGAK